MSGIIDFMPRRFGHANLWVSNIERSIQFYEGVLGLELVRRERLLKMGFHSNGNSHHDVGMIEISRGVDRYGRDGMVQIPKTRGMTVGLNHLAWEMASERELVEAYKRIQPLFDANLWTVDHIVAHSVYVPDPDGNLHEFYADALDDWRTVFNLAIEDEVTAAWDPLAKIPSDVHRYPVNPPIRSVPDAPLHPTRISRATLGTNDLERMVYFFVDIIGLRLKDRDQNMVRFGGSAGGEDLHVVKTPEGAKTGLQALTFVVPEEYDITAAATRLSENGIYAALSACSKRPLLTVTDPDGFRIEFVNPAN
ncbi:VOC family protein [Alphaproteobacteria bacterium]|nr:VOC family protein [Alphaproteobacteria bacterium]